MSQVPKFIRVNVFNLPDGVLQTSYYAHSAEQIGDTLVVDVRIDSPSLHRNDSPMTLSREITRKFDMVPLRRPVNIRLTQTQLEDDELCETEVEEEIFNPIEPKETSEEVWSYVERIAALKRRTHDFSSQPEITQSTQSTIDTNHHYEAIDPRLLASPDIEEETKAATPVVDVVQLSDIEEEDEEDKQSETSSKKRVRGNPDAIWLSKRKKPRSDKGKPRGIECPLCTNYRVILHQCSKCFNSFCKKCFEQLVDHEYDMDTCNVCRQKF